MGFEADAPDPEIVAISAVYAALRHLPTDAQARVLDYVAMKLRNALPADVRTTDQHRDADSEAHTTATPPSPSSATPEADEDGISDVGRKWVRRNSLDSSRLGTLFSLGADEIEVVARKVPGKTKKDRMRNVVLLKGVAAYLSGGVARISHAALKEACLHYDAYDETNSTKHMKSFAADVSGSAKTGYSLTSRGLTSATDLVKAMLAGGTA